MKEEINLLAPSVKAHRARKLLGDRLNYIWRRAVLMLLLCLVLMAVAYGVFTKNKRLFETSLSKSENQDAGTSEAVAKTNEFLTRFVTTIKENREWSKDFEEILKNVPSEVYLSEITARQSDGAFIIQGSTANRSKVIDFQRRLERISWVERVEAPLRNFATDSSGGFTFTVFPKVKKNI